MINAVPDKTDNNSKPQSPARCGYLQPDLVVVNSKVASRKRLLEQFAELIATSATINSGNREAHPQRDQIFAILHERERLGSTALGKGIALPHGRIQGLSQPVIAIAKLTTPIDYDSPDDIPIWLAVCLLVPAQAHEAHLNLLATLAAKFSNDDFVRELQKAVSTTEMYNLFSDI